MAIFSSKVIVGITKYANSLHDYGISIQRAYQKVGDMIDSLHSLDNANVNRVCAYEDLGQVILPDGSFKYPYLYIYVWKDKAKRPRSFSYTLDFDGTANILKMKFSSHVAKENKEYNEVNGLKRRVILTETALCRIIKRVLSACRFYPFLGEA